MDLQQLQQLLQQLQTDNQRLQQQVTHLTAQCPVPVPEKFSGQPEMFPAFVAVCQLYMAMRLEDFADDLARVAFIMNLLSGSAAQWATLLVLQNNPLMADYQGFWRQLRPCMRTPRGP
ncbi:protein LDOC1-like [Ahaetulla prasina]|uniref:protein LDOC1-like n=1 Tax=Ahaetulla prasina TaxID=499056 RepID=UPI002647751F|nr:protein LDOC1-like [Ahaetulla prasina]